MMKKLLLLLLILFSVSLVHASVWNNTVLHHVYNGNSNDISAYSNSGSDTGINYVLGKLNLSAYFDGGSDNIEVTASSTMGNIFNNSGAISIWVKINGSDTSTEEYNAVLMKRINPNGWMLQVRNQDDTSCGLRFHQEGATGTDGIWDSTSRNITFQVWTHLVVVYNSSNLNPPTIYINNKSILMTEIQQLVLPAGDDDAINLDIGANNLNAVNFNGTMDDLRLFNESLSVAEISLLYNETYGTEQNAPEAGEDIPGTGNPTFQGPTPPDGAINNTQIIINVSCDVGYNITLWFDNNTNPITKVINNKSSPANYTTAVVTEDTYYYKASCDSGVTNTSIRSWTFDETNPVIDLINNFFNGANYSLRNQYDDLLEINITVTDDNLYGFLFNLTNANKSLLNYSTQSLSGTSWNYNRTLDITGLGVGVYNITVSASDSHTANSIDNYVVTTKDKQIIFNTAEGNRITITSDLISSTSYKKLIDRYSFNYDFGATLTPQKVFTITSDKKINYLPNSIYTAHFVVWNNGKKEGNWIDFEGGGIPTVKRINDYEYRITFASLANKITFNSIGGLNVETLDFTWYRGKTILSENYSTSGFPATITLNITNHTSISNINATLNYNGTLYTNITQTNYSNFILFQKEITIPTIPTTTKISYYWNITTTQGDGNISIFEKHSNHSISFVGIDNCSNSFNISTNATAINISFFDEDNNVINIDYETTVTYWISPTVLYNYSFQIDNINFTQLCVYPDNSNFTANQQIKYTDSYGNIFDYFTYHTTLDNITNILNLYTQNGTTQVLFTVTDTDNNKIEDAYIHILKYNVGTGTYTTTEVLKTDTQGQALGNIVLGTTFYNFLIYYQGSLVYTESAVKLLATTRTFRINLLGTDWFTNFDTTLGVNTYLYFNNGTQNFVYTWSDPTSLMHYGCLRVDKQNDTGRYNLSNTCTESTSGTIIYNIPILENGTSYIGTGYLKFDNEIITDIVWHTIAAVRAFFRMDTMGSLFVAFLFCLTMFMIGIPNPVLSLSLLGAGVIFSSMLGLWLISGVMMGSIIFLILLQIYLSGRQTE